MNKLNQLNSTTYKLDKIKNVELDRKGEPKDEINVFVGDDKQPDFKPQVKIQRWTNEANFSVRLSENKKGKATHRKDKEKVLWEKGNLKAEFYEGDNAYKFVWYLKKKPKTNKVQFTIQSKDVDFLYQQTLREMLGEYEVLQREIEPLIKKEDFSSFVDIGGGTGEIAKKFSGTCIESSQEAYSKRVTDNYINKDIKKGIPEISDNQYDLTTGIGFLKYLQTESDIEKAIKEIARISKRGMFFVGQGFEYFEDTLLKSFNGHDKDYWLARFERYAPNYEIEIYDISNIKRPEYVEGSYAVYSKSSGELNDKDGKDYKVGKVGHIYRPHIIDAEGKETWGDLHIENGIYEVTIPQEFLDKVVYPIRSNDTFGYESVGSSKLEAAGSNDISIRAGEFTGGSGTLDSISVYTSSSSSGDDLSVGLYADSDKSLVGADETLNIGTNDDWHSITMSDESISSVSYWLAVSALRTGYYGPEVHYDSGTTDQWAEYPLNEEFAGPYLASSSWPDTISWGNHENRKLSIYATYTPSGGTTYTSPLPAFRRQ